MMPAQVMTGTVPVFSNPSAQLADFVQQLLPRHMIEIGVHGGYLRVFAVPKAAGEVSDPASAPRFRPNNTPASKAEVAARMPKE
jgi:hypothetical protein